LFFLDALLFLVLGVHLGGYASTFYGGFLFWNGEAALNKVDQGASLGA
jgi:hypothetical protein